MKSYYFPSFNGASCFSDGQVITAIVNRKGNKKVDKSKTTNKVIPWNVFFFRGLEFFVLGFIAQISTFMKTFDLQQEQKHEEGLVGKISDKLNIATKYVRFFTALILGLLIGGILFGLLPSLLARKILEGERYASGLMIGLLRIAFFYCILLIFRFLPFMQELYRFNASCNKLAQANGKINEISKKSVHFSLNFLNFVVFALILSTFVISLVQISGKIYVVVAVNLAITLACIGLSYELLWAISVLKYKWLNDFIWLTSFLVVVRPSLTEEETVRITLIEENFNQEVMVEKDKIPISAVISEMQTKLINADRFVQSDVDWIIATVLGKNRAEAKLVRSVSPKEYREILRATDRRSKGEPLSSIFGYVDFYGLRLDVNKKVLSPRMETEILVENAIKLAKDFKKPEICDLCTGSGAIAISLKKNIDTKVVGIDISKAALAVAEANAKKHNVKIDFVQSDLFAGLKKNKRFDIIVSNPPYIPSKECEKLPVEVKKFDPRLALDGGEDGLDFYRNIIQQSQFRLNKNGVLMFEVGKGQASKVRSLMKGAGFIDTHIIKDYNNIERVVYGRR